MSPRTIAKFAIGPLGGAMLSLITLPMIAWYFTIEDVGRIAMLNIAISFSILFFSLGLDQVYVREYHEEKNQRKLLKTISMPGLVIIVITLISLLSLGDFISYLLFDVESQFLSLLAAIAILSAFVSRYSSLILRMGEKGLSYSMGQILPKLLLIIIVLGYLLFSVDKDLNTLLLANVTSIFLVCVIYMYSTKREWIPSISEKIDYYQLKKYLAYSFPLIFGGCAFWGLTAIDRVFLRLYTSFEELGVYSVAVSFAAVASILQSVFSTVWAPMVYKWASKDEGVERVIKVTRYVLAAVVMLFCLAGMLSWVITLFLPDDYSAVQWVVLSCLGAPLLYTLSETTVVGIGITRRTGFAMLAALIAFCVNLVGNWLLIPHFGASGAAVSTCISFFVFFVLRTEFSIYLWQPMPRLVLYGYTLFMVVGACIFTLCGEELYSYMLGFWFAAFISSLNSFKLELSETVKFIAVKLGIRN